MLLLIMQGSWIFSLLLAKLSPSDANKVKPVLQRNEEFVEDWDKLRVAIIADLSSQGVPIIEAFHIVSVVHDNGKLLRLEYILN